MIVLILGGVIIATQKSQKYKIAPQPTSNTSCHKAGNIPSNYSTQHQFGEIFSPPWFSGREGTEVDTHSGNTAEPTKNVGRNNRTPALKHSSSGERYVKFRRFSNLILNPDLFSKDFFFLYHLHMVSFIPGITKTTGLIKLGGMGGFDCFVLFGFFLLFW